MIQIISSQFPDKKIAKKVEIFPEILMEKVK